MSARPGCSSKRLSLAVMASKQASREQQIEAFFKKRPRIILGSESASRKAIMTELARKYGFEYETAKAAIDESAIGSRKSQPGVLVALLAKAKADAIRANLRSEDGFLLTSDQVVVHNGKILEKPRDEIEARRFIRGYGEQPASTVGSLLCTNLSDGSQHEAIDVTQVCFRPIPEEVVTQLIKQGEIFQCAGGLMIEDPLVTPLITSITGTEDAVKGLCKDTALNLLLKAAGLDFKEEEPELWDADDIY